MQHWLIIIVLGLSCAICAGVNASEKPHILAAIDLDTEAIQLEFENQAEAGCFWSPYRVGHAIEEELKNYGFQTARSSLNVLSVITWGVATDEYHCSVVLESKFRRYSVRAGLSEDSLVNTDLLLWDASDLLTGPKIHMDDRIHNTAMGHLRQFQQAVSRAGN